MKYTLSNDNQFKSLCKGPVTIPENSPDTDLSEAISRQSKTYLAFLLSSFPGTEGTAKGTSKTHKVPFV